MIKNNNNKSITITPSTMGERLEATISAQWVTCSDKCTYIRTWPSEWPLAKCSKCGSKEKPY